MDNKLKAGVIICIWLICSIIGMITNNSNVLFAAIAGTLIIKDMDLK